MKKKDMRLIFPVSPPFILHKLLIQLNILRYYLLLPTTLPTINFVNEHLF